MAEYSNRLKYLREEELGISQREIAEKTGVSLGYINGAENENKELTRSQLKRICITYSVNMDWLMTGKGDIFLQRKWETEFEELIAVLDEDLRGLAFGILRVIVEYQKRRKKRP